MLPIVEEGLDDSRFHLGLKVPIEQPHARFKDGRLKAIGITSSKRAQSNPEIPTIGEVVPGYASDTWYGLLAPAGTPKDVIAKLHAAAAKGLASPAARERLTKLGAEPVGNTPEEFRKLLEAEQKTWTKVVQDSGARANE